MGRTVGVPLVLLLLALVAAPLSAQEPRPAGPGSGPTSGFQLEQNYPNPFNPETKIPFVLHEDLFAAGRPVVVTVRIYNLLQQVVAVPTALRHPLGEGEPVLNLEYPRPGAWEAFWDGRDQNGRQVASGIYFMQLTVNGQSQIRKMYVAK